MIDCRVWYEELTVTYFGMRKESSSVTGYSEAGYLAALSGTIRSSSSIPIKFNIILYNRDQNYDQNSGVFQVPYSGMYHIYSQLNGDEQTNFDYHIRVDGSAIIYTEEYAQSTGTDRSATVSIVYHLEEGQKLTLTTARSNLEIFGSSSTVQSWFGASLLYAD